METKQVCLPNHIGIIMDGNRRWAKKRLLPAAMGHKKGAEVFRERVRDLSQMGVKNATFYALSTENLQRSAGEVESLMKLFESQLEDISCLANDEKIRLLFIGDTSVFSEKLQRLISTAERDSAVQTGLVCRIAINYGARDEIVRAVKACGDSFADKLVPDADLIIRTGGERRLSNFLLWQAAYAELYFTDTLWCDFDRRELVKALEDYSNRNRRLGK
jgi:undecaprenyl diphosphate synthase